MRTLLTLLTLIFISVFSSPDIKTSKLAKDASFSWLLGSWERVNEKDGKQTFEHWKQASKELYLGMGCTLKEGDTIWKETIELRKLGKNWNFEVKGKGESQPTVFAVTKIEKEGFVCENPENEFPKIISYKKSKTGLNAMISGGGPDITFDFKKID
ncbi:DUF6265 family protein [Lutimonas halocynthiae]|uniref:DUF6265 family protein n=1 Tax=Lutimonas halocynthiae TaxID=1446477 RepID=UPI0025B447C6|nr:DUF6265 family protein [Lutimonas halocynthiae]MDN3641452.1 DUF6265 family protein [Lutimonas halocynthiae]